MFIETHKIAFFLLILFPMACSHTGQEEPKSDLEYLNGERYRSNVNLGVIPLVVEHHPRSTLIQGRVVSRRSSDAVTIKLPLRFCRIVLFEGDKLLATTTADEGGNFSFVGDYPDGSYAVSIEEPRFHVRKDFRINGYHATGLEIEALEKPDTKPG